MATQGEHDGRPSESAGGRGRRPGRPPRRPAELNRSVIVAAAKALLSDASHPGDLSLRRLAAELDVTAMALYRYVADKDELLELIVDESLADLGLPTSDPADWRAWMRELSTMLHGLIVHNRVAAHVFSTRPVVTPAGLRRIEAALGVLRGAGFTEPAAVSVFAQTHTLTLGFACLAASRAERAERPSRAPHIASWGEFFRSLPGDVYPLLVRCAPDLAAFTSPEEYRASLDRLLGVFAAELDAAGGRGR